MVHRKASQEGSTEIESHCADRGGARGFLRAEKWAAARRTEAEAPTCGKHKPSTNVKEANAADRGGGSKTKASTKKEPTTTGAERRRFKATYAKVDHFAKWIYVLRPLFPLRDNVSFAKLRNVRESRQPRGALCRAEAANDPQEVTADGARATMLCCCVLLLHLGASRGGADRAAADGVARCAATAADGEGGTERRRCAKKDPFGSFAVIINNHQC